MRPFFIFALPRSGTAWMANFLTYGNSYCYHELLSEHFDVSRMESQFYRNGSEFVGNSDCGNMFFFANIVKTFKNPKIVVVERSPKEVAMSMAVNGYSKEDVPVYESMLSTLRAIHRSTDSILVEYKDLADERTAREILDHVTDCEGKFNAERFDFLKNTNVQVENLHMKNRIEKIRNMRLN